MQVNESVLSPQAYHAITGYLSITFVISLVANGFILVVFTRTPSLRDTSSVLLISLTTCDLLSSVLAKPVAIYANMVKWTWMDRHTCVYYALITTALGFSTMLHLTSLSVERWMALTWPMKYKEMSTYTKMLVLLGFLWLFSVIWSVFPVFGWSSYGPEPGYAACSITWYEESASNKSYIICTFLLFFFIPVLIMAACYRSLVVAMKNIHRDAIKRNDDYAWVSLHAWPRFHACFAVLENPRWLPCDKGKCIQGTPGTRWGERSQAALESAKAETQTAWMAFAMVIAFLFAWTPYAVVSLRASFSGGLQSVSPLVGTVPALLAKSSSCYNPFIYFFMYARFRRAAKKILKRNGIHQMPDNMNNARVFSVAAPNSSNSSYRASGTQRGPSLTPCPRDNSTPPHPPLQELSLLTLANQLGAKYLSNGPYKN